MSLQSTNPKKITEVRRGAVVQTGLLALQLSAFEDSRQVKNMVEIAKIETGGTPFLNKKTVLDQGVKIVKIKTEPEPVETEYEGKKSTRLQCIATTQVLDPKEVRWQMNATTQNFLIDKYGKQTKNWIGKEIEIAVKQAGSASPGVYPKECSLEKVY